MGVLKYTQSGMKSRPMRWVRASRFSAKQRRVSWLSGAIFCIILAARCARSDALENKYLDCIGGVLLNMQLEEMDLSLSVSHNVLSRAIPVLGKLAPDAKRIHQTFQNEVNVTGYKCDEKLGMRYCHDQKFKKVMDATKKADRDMTRSVNSAIHDLRFGTAEVLRSLERGAVQTWVTFSKQIADCFCSKKL